MQIHTVLKINSLFINYTHVWVNEHHLQLINF